MLRRLLPQPLMSVALLVTWLLAMNTLAPGVVLLGAVFAVGLPLFTQRFWPEYPRTVRLGPLLRLSFVVIYDIIVANVRVAVLILGPRARLQPRFIEIPVELESPLSITLLASIISMTPGTVSSNLSRDRRRLLVHGLDVRDAQEEVAKIKARYERPLKEIFSC